MIPLTIGTGLNKWGIPRESGDDPNYLVHFVDRDCVFPARAGMILEEETQSIPIECIPRESGDDPPC